MRSRRNYKLGFIGQGSVQTRRIACGSPTCRWHHDPDARHGPYHYWTRKARGKTVGLKLTEDELGLYREWIENNRELERGNGLVEQIREQNSLWYRVRRHVGVSVVAKRLYTLRLYHTEAPVSLPKQHLHA